MKLAQESLAGRVALLHLSSISQNEFYGSGENRPFSVSVEEIAKRSRERIPTDVNGMFERVFKGTMPGHISGKYTNRDVFYSSYLPSACTRFKSTVAVKAHCRARASGYKQRASWNIVRAGVGARCPPVIIKTFTRII